MRLIETETALWKLSSAYEACTFSVCSPVSIPTDDMSPFSHIFYDCTDPEKEGIEIMNQRIKEGKDDILSHLRIHDTLLKNFYSLDEALKTENRARIVEESKHVFENLENYGNLVGKHSERFQERAFLHYPTCLSGHYFVDFYTRRVKQKVFNPQQNQFGFRVEITWGKEALANFPLSSSLEKLKEIRMYEGHDSGEGTFETSFRVRLELTRLLLERAGFYS